MSNLPFPPIKSLVNSGGPFGIVWAQWFVNLFQWVGGNAFSGTVTLAALTPIGTQGSLTIVNGRITTLVPPT